MRAHSHPRASHPPDELHFSWFSKRAAAPATQSDPRKRAPAFIPFPKRTVFTRPWWFGLLARMHINSFRVDIPRPLERNDFAALAESLERGSGTAVYALPSLYNHDCEPNADVAWIDGDATMSVIARQAIAAGAEDHACLPALLVRRRPTRKCDGAEALFAGEEVRITYIDSMQTLEDRRRRVRTSVDHGSRFRIFLTALILLFCLPSAASFSSDTVSYVSARCAAKRQARREGQQQCDRFMTAVARSRC